MSEPAAPEPGAARGDAPPARFLGIEVEILVLGLVSFLTDASSELIFSVLSVFLATTRQAPARRALIPPA